MTKLDKEEILRKILYLREKAFSFVYEAESILNRVVLLSLVIVFLIWFNLSNIVNLLVSENKIKQNITGKLAEISGKKAQIDGSVIFESEPEPIAIVSKARILNDSKLTDEDFFEAETIKTKPKILSAIIGRTDFDDIYFENVRINADAGTKDDDNDIKGTISKIFATDSDFRGKRIILKNLQVNLYKKNILNEKKPIIKRYEFPELEFNPRSGSVNNDFEIKGSFDSSKFQETYYFNVDIKDGLGKESPFDGKIYSTSSDLKFSGKIDTKEQLNFSGKLQGKFGGITKKLFSTLGFSETFIESLKDNDQSNISANFLYNKNSFNISDFVSEGNVISFILNEKTEFGDTSDSSVDVKVTKFNYSQMFKSRLELLSEKKAQKVERDFKKKLEEYFLFAVSDDVNFSLTLSIPRIDFFHDKTGSLYMVAELKNNLMKINSFKAQLPGDSSLSLIGLAEINKEEKKLKGASRLIMGGKSMDELSFALNGMGSNDKRFGPYYIDAKGFLYGQNIHFRDIVARINDDKMAGQMLIDYSKELRASAAFNFTSLNLDKYLPQDKDVQAGIIKEENALSSKFDFLRVIDSIFDKLDVSLVADNMVKAGDSYRDVSVFAQISPGLTEIRDIYFNSDVLGEVSGKAHLDLTDFQPKLDVDLKIDKYDLDLLMYGEEVHQNDKYAFDGRWSNEKINFERLGNFIGKLNLNIKEMKIFHFLLKDLVLSSHAEENRFTIDQARTNLFGSKIDFRGILTTDYPSFNMTFVSSDLDSAEFMSDTFNLDQIRATFNISGALSSTGYSIEQMAQNLKGNFSVATKGFTVSGFDLTAVGKALPLAKRREYIKLISDELLNKGETAFSYFSGGFYVDSGQIIFNNLTLTGPNLDKAVVSGKIDIPKWQVDIDSDMMVKTTDNVSFALQGKTTGTIPHIRTQWEDKGMTKFWEDKFYGGR